MTGAADGDVERALAAMGAAPLKYHSFGAATVRPAGTPPGVSVMPPRDPATAAVLITDTAHPFTPQSTTAVFPLLGRALPEAFQVDVEPRWPSAHPATPRRAGSLGDQASRRTDPWWAGVAMPDFAAPLPPPVLAPGVAPPPVVTRPAPPAAPFSLPDWLSPDQDRAPASTPHPATLPPSPRQPSPSQPSPSQPSPSQPSPSQPSPSQPSQRQQPRPYPFASPALSPTPVPTPPAAPLPATPPPSQADTPDGAFPLPPWLEPPPAAEPVPSAVTPLDITPTPLPPLERPFSPFADSDATIRPPPAAPGSFPAWLEPLPPAPTNASRPIAVGAGPSAGDAGNPAFLSPPAGSAAAGAPNLPNTMPDIAPPPPFPEHLPLSSRSPAPQPTVVAPPVLVPPMVSDEPPMFREPPMFQTPDLPTVTPVTRLQQSPLAIDPMAVPAAAVPVASTQPARPAAGPGKKPLSDLFRTLGARPPPVSPQVPPFPGSSGEDRSSSF